MNRLTFLLVASSFMFLTTLVVDSMGLDNPDNPISGTPNQVDDSVSSIFSSLDTFFNLLTFNVDGIPIWFNSIFLIIAIGTLYVILTIVKDVIPFT